MANCEGGGAGDELGFLRRTVEFLGEVVDAVDSPTTTGCAAVGDDGGAGKGADGSGTDSAGSGGGGGAPPVAEQLIEQTLSKATNEVNVRNNAPFIILNAGGDVGSIGAAAGAI
jgi:hypothetical protein